ncbi:hypothetical protein FDP41_010756 [Naegleria fowleri]|uniref:Uncharacterized protein n=1 Tax=Naegleria fowleri TaxID=5763 RepID=A0A6A5BZW9_NAEFO|nr:uncharacterized protein FDP41_010756 [Naegleria fowleri]KAF0982777.1 hypothetical protein FDP41_010756 [Naegleria fowleri]
MKEMDDDEPATLRCMKRFLTVAEVPSHSSCNPHHQTDNSVLESFINNYRPFQTNNTIRYRNHVHGSHASSCPVDNLLQNTLHLFSSISSHKISNNMTTTCMKPINGGGESLRDEETTEGVYPSCSSTLLPCKSITSLSNYNTNNHKDNNHMTSIAIPVGGACCSLDDFVAFPYHHPPTTTTIHNSTIVQPKDTLSEQEDEWHQRITQLAMVVADKIEQKTIYNRLNGSSSSSSSLYDSINPDLSGCVHEKSSSMCGRSSSSQHRTSSLPNMLLTSLLNQEDSSLQRLGEDPIHELLLSTFTKTSNRFIVDSALQPSSTTITSLTNSSVDHQEQPQQQESIRNSGLVLSERIEFHFQFCSFPPKLERIITAEPPLTFEQAGLLPPLNLKLKFTHDEVQEIDQLLNNRIPSSGRKRNAAASTQSASHCSQNFNNNNHMNKHNIHTSTVEGREVSYKNLHEFVFPVHNSQLLSIQEEGTKKEFDPALDPCTLSLSSQCVVSTLSSDENCHEDDSSVFPIMEEVVEIHHAQEEAEEKHRLAGQLSQPQTTPNNFNTFFAKL